MRIDPSRLPSMTPARKSSNEYTRGQNIKNMFGKHRKCPKSEIIGSLWYGRKMENRGLTGSPWLGMGSDSARTEPRAPGRFLDASGVPGIP